MPMQSSCNPYARVNLSSGTNSTIIPGVNENELDRNRPNRPAEISSIMKLVVKYIIPPQDKPHKIKLTAYVFVMFNQGWSPAHPRTI